MTPNGHMSIRTPVRRFSRSVNLYVSNLYRLCISGHMYAEHEVCEGETEVTIDNARVTKDIGRLEVTVKKE
eukprot:CAMPEP_0175876900 /NCGR_PEP_ID=MMETSP0107_2-20121207/40305_1 /TAXON_ID=195067 ORGANISM="Goniomonas pacifica, Strain CCMP1869" /NCGR_SAMPLE_ID=MMETSP0107_2 /ASSEMBLY_ACC=CAM_ASM_000203 /LENGTH=70 /DNA_ID=CAMNT_0017196157 /DNA_START=462 /DNA_END=674 /DNA_ORIENTATION=-